MANPEEEEDPKKWGMGKVFLQSIQTLLLKANYAVSIGDFFGWRNHLDCIIRKCLGRFSPEEQEYYNNISERLETISLNHMMSKNRDSRQQHVTTSKRTMILAKEHGSILSEYEIFIIKVLDRLNWLVPSEKRKRPPH